MYHAQREKLKDIGVIHSLPHSEQRGIICHALVVFDNEELIQTYAVQKVQRK
jgi:hypothetical protein